MYSSHLIDQVVDFNFRTYRFLINFVSLVSIVTVVLKFLVEMTIFAWKPI